MPGNALAGSPGVLFSNIQTTSNVVFDVHTISLVKYSSPGMKTKSQALPLL